MTPEQNSLFIKTLVLVFDVQQKLPDRFFRNRITRKIELLLQNHIDYSKHPNDFNLKTYLQSLRDLELMLEEISYLKKSEPVSLAVARENILSYIQYVLRHVKPKEATLDVKSEPVNSEEKARRPVRLNTTQEKILEFVRRAPERRTKEIIDQFSALSDRTVKRSLKELSREGLVIKKVENRAVYYSAR